MYSGMFADKNQVKSFRKQTKKIPKDWTYDEMYFLFFAHEWGLSQISIARKLGKNIDDVRRTYEETHWPEMDFYQFNFSKLNETRKRELVQSFIESDRKKYEEELTKTIIIADKIADIVQAYPVSNVPPKKSKVKQTEDEEMAVMISDCHIGTACTYEETNDITEYNMDVFQKFAENLKKQIFKIHKRQSASANIDTLNVFCLGDIVHGMNNAGKWSPAYMDAAVYDQFIMAFDTLSQMIYDWLSVFKKIKIYSLYGNHGRTAQKEQEKDYVNWDFLCSKFIECRFKDNPKVEVKMTKAWYMMEDVQEHKFLLLHGHTMNAGQGTIGKASATTSRLSAIKRVFPDYTLCGHFHDGSEAWTNSGKIITNGCFPGGDHHSVSELQKYHQPMQKVFGINKNEGISWQYDVILNKEV